ncbi:MAG: acetyl-CoA carboxylase biotin carboxyl carrier protein [Bacteroidia bacterium]
MDLREIRELIRLVNSLNVSEVEIAEGDFKLRIVRNTAPSVVYTTAPAVAPAPVALPAQEPAAIAAPKAEKSVTTDESAGLYTFKSPMIGTFYRTPSPDLPPFANVGDVIKKGQKICIIEAMKLFNEIECDVAGKIVKVLVDNSSPVEYDKPLFLIDTNI